MEMIPLQSGSNGNCCLVRDHGVQLLFDAGISGLAVHRRLAELAIDPASIDALFLSHEHSDHSRYLGSLSKRFGWPVLTTESTWQALPAGVRKDVRERTTFRAGDSVRVGTLQIHSLPTPHDAVDGVAFIVESRGRRAGILTDLGHVFDELRSVMLTLDAVLIESNYDRRMLETGPYPPTLKRRIRGRGGHLSNDEAADLVACAATFRRLQWACLGHLSKENNSPNIALATLRLRVGKKLPLFVAARDGTTRLPAVDAFRVAACESA